MGDHSESHKKNQADQISAGSGNTDKVMDLQSLLSEIEERLADATQRRFTGEIRLTFNINQGGFGTIYIEKERESLVRKREGKPKK